jgi:hypothetical protein
LKNRRELVKIKSTSEIGMLTPKNSVGKQEQVSNEQILLKTPKKTRKNETVDTLTELAEENQLMINSAAKS